MTETESGAEPRAGAEGATGSRRKLTEEQEREVTRLYADTETPVSEISKRFGIGESSVYRVAQRHGAQLRGRTSSGAASGAPGATGTARRGRRPSTRTAAGTSAAKAPSGTGTGRRGRRPGTAATATSTTAAPANGRRRRGAAAATTRAATTSTGTGRGRRGGARTAAAATATTTGARRGRRPGSAASTSAASSAGARSWRVSYTASRVFNAASMADAIKQAEAAGATEIVGITRND
jgi:transposase-like protein